MRMLAMGRAVETDLGGGEAVGLGLAELVEGLGGSAFVEGAEFCDALHLEESGVVVGIVEKAVLGLDFD